MKRIVCALVALCFAFCLSACALQPAEGPLVVTATSREGHDAALAMDGDVSTGWIGARKANDTTPQILNIDLGRRVSFSKVTIDDSFADGYTNRKPEYVAAKPAFRRGDATSISVGTSIPNLFTGTADGRGWKSEEIPSDTAPQKVYFTLSSALQVQKLTFDNDMNGTVPAKFAVYYTPEQVDGDGLDENNYELLAEVKDNADAVCDIELQSVVSVRSMLIVIYSQTGENGATEAEMDEIFFYVATPDDYSEPHYPVRFHLMGSVDGETYEIFAEENGNYSEIWEKEFSSALEYRYIKYLLFEENGNNYPSIAEISFG